MTLLSLFLSSYPSSCSARTKWWQRVPGNTWDWDKLFHVSQITKATRAHDNTCFNTLLPDLTRSKAFILHVQFLSLKQFWISKPCRTHCIQLGNACLLNTEYWSFLVDTGHYCGIFMWVVLNMSNQRIWKGFFIKIMVLRELQYIV